MNNKNTQVYIVIPAYNEEQVIQDVLQEVQQSGYSNLIVVDDGSSDHTYIQAQKKTDIVLKHIINRGKGATIKTGIEAAKIMQADVVVTLDGDGQHNPQDIDRMLEKIYDGYDVVLGSRLIDTTGMPSHKIVANKLGNFFTWVLYGIWVSDRQSGFRGYSKKALSLINTTTDRYEYDSEVLREIKRNKLNYIEIPIEVRYTAYSLGKQHKQSFVNGLKTLLRMILST